MKAPQCLHPPLKRPAGQIQDRPSGLSRRSSSLPGMVRPDSSRRGLALLRARQRPGNGAWPPGPGRSRVGEGRRGALKERRKVSPARSALARPPASPGPTGPGFTPLALCAENLSGDIKDQSLSSVYSDPPLKRPAHRIQDR